MKKDEQDYIKDIAEIRSMMERSSKFLSLSGWAGIMAGIFALAGAWLAYSGLYFNPDELVYSLPGNPISGLLQLVLLALGILILAIGTAVYLSFKKAGINGEKLWNPTARRLVIAMAVPLIAGGLFILILISHGLTGLMAPCSLIFYGIALVNAGRYTFKELKTLGLIQILLGLLGAWFIGYGLLFWALGFGIFHIIYGIYMHFKYEQ